MRHEVTAIVARADNGVIGRGGTMPWHLPADLMRFKALTLGPDGRGTAMIMGRKTFASLPGVLPGRRHIVLTRDPLWRASGAEVAHSAAEALELAAGGPASVIGGAEIYRLMLPHTTAIELTEIHAAPAGDTILPPFGAEWREVARDDHPAQGDRPAYSFVRLERG